MAPRMDAAGTAGPTRFSAAVGVLEGMLDCHLREGAARAPLLAAPFKSRRRGGRRSESRPPRPSKGYGGGCHPESRTRRGGGRKGPSCYRGRGAAPRGGWAVPTCARWQAPAPRRAGGSPARRAAPPIPLFPLARPKTAPQRRGSPPVPKPPRGGRRPCPAPRQGSAPGVERRSRPLRRLLPSNLRQL